MTSEHFTRRFGVEIEITSDHSREQVASTLRAHGIACQDEDYTHRTTNHWKVVRDGSCGNEVVSPVLEGAEGLRQVKKVCEILSEIGCRVDRRCGVHVHYDARSMSVKNVRNVFKLWAIYEDVLDSLQPVSRRLSNNTYCRSIFKCAGEVTPMNAAVHTDVCGNLFRRLDRCTTIEQMATNCFQGQRYTKLNIQSYFRHRTIEVRHHSGSVNAEKLTNWIVLMGRLFDTAERLSCVRNRYETSGFGRSRLAAFLKTIGATDQGKFFRARAKQLRAS